MILKNDYICKYIYLFYYNEKNWFLITINKFHKILFSLIILQYFHNHCQKEIIFDVKLYYFFLYSIIYLFIVIHKNLIFHLIY